MDEWKNEEVDEWENKGVDELLKKPMNSCVLRANANTRAGSLPREQLERPRFLYPQMP